MGYKSMPIYAENKEFKTKEDLIPEIKNKLRYIGKADSTANEYYVCPYCGRGKRGETTFVLNSDTGLFRCFRDNCQAKGNYIVLAKYLGINPVKSGSSINYSPQSINHQPETPVKEPETDWESIQNELIFNDTKILSGVTEYKFIDEFGNHIQSEHRQESSIGSKKIWQSYIINGKFQTHKPSGFIPCLYNSNYIKSASTIFFVEGPKKADLLNDIFKSENLFPTMLAVSVPGGSNYNSELNKYFTQNQIILFLGDGDSASLKLFKKLYSEVSGRVKEIKKINLPVYKIKKADKYKFCDIADFIQFGKWGFSEIQENILLKKNRLENEPELNLLPENIIEDDLFESDTIVFWDYKTVKEGDSEYTKAKINTVRFIQFLEQKGFSWFYVGSDNSEHQFIRITDNLITPSSEINIREYVKKWIEKDSPTEDRQDLIEEIVNPYCKLFGTGYLTNLNPVILEIHRDSKNKSYIYYKNCFVEVSKDSVIAKEYSELDGLLWEKKKLNRNYNHNDLGYKEGVFYKFSENINSNNPDKLRSYMAAIGYLLHRYKDPTITKAVLISDQKFNEQAEGRSGKSLTGKAIQQIRRLAYEDGKNFDPDAVFKYQKVDYDTEVFQLDDTKKNFNFESFFATITGDWTVEKKNKQSFNIPFEDSPKIFIPCNYMPNLNGGSALARAFRHYIDNYYSKDFTPTMDFGKTFFDKTGETFDDTDWILFDNFMIECLRVYFNFGLNEYVDPESTDTELKHRFGQNFVEFFREKLSDLVVGDFHLDPKELHTDFIEFSGESEKFWSQRKFSQYLIDFLRANKITADSKPVKTAGKLKRKIVGRADNNSLLKQAAESNKPEIAGEITPINDYSDNIF